MGDPKKIRKKYSTPSHPWQKARIDEEKVVKRDFGLKNKKEIWIIASKLKTFKDTLKRLNPMEKAKQNPKLKKSSSPPTFPSIRIY